MLRALKYHTRLDLRHSSSHGSLPTEIALFFK